MNRIALVKVDGVAAGRLEELTSSRKYRFEYLDAYAGPPVSLTIPNQNDSYDFERFPPFFDGLLPEGYRLEALLRWTKLDRHDYMGQLLAVGSGTVGYVTVEPWPTAVELNYHRLRRW